MKKQRQISIPMNMYMYIYMSSFFFEPFCVPTELLRPSIEPPPIQHIQTYHTIDTAGKCDRGIAVPIRHPSHPMRALLITIQSPLTVINIFRSAIMHEHT